MSKSNFATDGVPYWSSPPYFSLKKEWNNKVIDELQTTGGTPKAGYLRVIQMTAVQENQQVTSVNHGKPWINWSILRVSF